MNIFRSFPLIYPLTFLLVCCSQDGKADPGEPVTSPALFGPRQADGDGSVNISGELMIWHKVTLTLDGPYAHEKDNQPNPFTDRQMNVTFTHESGDPTYVVPGYFAADGRAGETSAESGTSWRAHLSPDKTGTWNYSIAFKGTPFDGKSGTFQITPSDKSGIDLRGKGRLQYVENRYLKFAGSGEYFLKAGADAPETFLAYVDFDNTVTADPKRGKLKTWEPHVKDWQTGDPTWQDGKGKGMIGAINYLAEKGANAFSFIPYNAGGDGDNVWPHLSREDKVHFDCSKLDQWGIVFDHGTAKGMFLHFKLQETENDDLQGKGKGLEHALDDGDLGIERKAYLREMIARFGHNLALNWNVGEENTQDFEQSSAMIRYLRETDPYGHLVVMHTYPNQQDMKYEPYLGKREFLTGLSLQNSDVSHTHREIVKWIEQSKASGHPWVVCSDEAGSAASGTPPDPDYPGMKGILEKEDPQKTKIPSPADIRGDVLWGTLLGGGMGVEYYFGYRLPQNDLNAEDWRSRDQLWDASHIALEFFRNHKIPFWEMENADALVDNADHQGNERYCLAKAGEFYLVYFRSTENPALDLSEASGTFSVQWFNPRTGGQLESGSLKSVTAGGETDLGAPPADASLDWVVIVRTAN